MFNLGSNNLLPFLFLQTIVESIQVTAKLEQIFCKKNYGLSTWTLAILIKFARNVKLICGMRNVTTSLQNTVHQHSQYVVKMDKYNFPQKGNLLSFWHPFYQEVRKHLISSSVYGHTIHCLHSHRLVVKLITK